MARTRKSRFFAPEFLETRLSLSGTGDIVPPPADVQSAEEPLPVDADGDPIPPPASDPGDGQPMPV